MMQSSPYEARIIIAFSLVSSYIITFVFEGRVLLQLLRQSGSSPDAYVISAMAAHFIGLLSCPAIIKTPGAIRRTVFPGAVICVVTSALFFFLLPPVIRLAALLAGGYTSGCIVAVWGCFLKTFIEKQERTKVCADMLILTNLMMIGISVVSEHASPAFALGLSLSCLVAGILMMARFPIDHMCCPHTEGKEKVSYDSKKALWTLFAFIAVITINSGLMYQVINPAFAHLDALAHWYWAVPYIAALMVMKRLFNKAKCATALYVGMGMIMASFICFMLLERNISDYLLINTLMLGACGVFDLFWWSIMSEMLDHLENPILPFGIGLSANVFGVLCGSLLGTLTHSRGMPAFQVTVIALSVVCVAVAILPFLNRQLLMLLNNHAYLIKYQSAGPAVHSGIPLAAKPRVELTSREKEVLGHILHGLSGREIAQQLCVSEYTVKSHTSAILAKYDVNSRTRLISLLLGNQAVE